MRAHLCRPNVRVALLCALWYAISATSSIINKLVLQQYPFPMTVGLSSLMCIPICAAPFLRLWEKRRITLSRRHFFYLLMPISMGRCLAVASAHFSLWKMPVSYTHTIKATMPLFAVGLSRLILKERQSTRVYASLLPIIAGVIIASATELSFSGIGLLSALFSTFMYSFLNILVKKVLRETDIHPIRLLSLNSEVAAMLYFPFWLYEDATSIFMASNSNSDTSPGVHMLLMLILSGVLSFAQNVCSFTLIHELAALSYAVCNATKRITVITASLLTLHNPVTPANIFGMCLAILGVFGYNRAKQSEKEAHKSLPLTRTHTTLSDATLISMDTKAMYSPDNSPHKMWRSEFSSNGSRLASVLGRALNSDDDPLTMRSQKTDDFRFHRLHDANGLSRTGKFA